MKVKQEVWKTANLAESVYMDLMARGKDIEAVRYIGKYLNMQPYHVRKYNCERWLGVSHLDRLFSIV